MRANPRRPSSMFPHPSPGASERTATTFPLALYSPKLVERRLLGSPLSRFCIIRVGNYPVVTTPRGEPAWGGGEGIGVSAFLSRAPRSYAIASLMYDGSTSQLVCTKEQNAIGMRLPLRRSWPVWSGGYALFMLRRSERSSLEFGRLGGAAFLRMLRLGDRPQLPLEAFDVRL